MSRVKLEKPKGITDNYQKAYKVLSDWLKKTYDDMDEPISDVLNELEEIFEKRSIEIPFTEGDLQDLIYGETFDWEFEGVKVHLEKVDSYFEDEEDEED